MMVQYSEKNLDDFRSFLERQLKTKRTTNSYLGIIHNFLTEFDGQTITSGVIQKYLSRFDNRNTYRNHLVALRVYFHEFLRVPLCQGFSVPQVAFIPKAVPSKKDLQRFFNELDSLMDKTLFLLFASSGLRRAEVLSLPRENIDLKNRALLPRSEGKTKRTWVAFFNEEAELYLRQYMAEKPKGTLFPEKSTKKIWAVARKKTGLNITPQVLREWFAQEMSKLGVPDRFIDAFQGRIPRSVLARHYTDYSLENLKKIYDKAGLRVLS